MLFGKHINRYYIKHLPMLLLGVGALLLVDYFQLLIPELYESVLHGMNNGYAVVDGVEYVFDMNFLLDRVCLPLVVVLVAMVFGRFLWRICFFGSGRKVETDLRKRMFDHSKGLSQQYYQVNKVGNLMSLFTNDIETVQDCFGSGILMFCDALLLGVMALYKMFRMDAVLTAFALIPMALMLCAGVVVGKYMMKKWEQRQAAFSDISDFSQESFSGIAVVKAFVKEFTELMSFRRLNKQNEDANIAYTKASTLLHIFVTLFVESVICIVLGYGGYLVYKDVFTASQLIEYISYFNAIVWPVMAISQLIEMQSRGKASLNRISQLLDAKPSVVDKDNVYEINEIKGDIEFRNLTFKYPGSDLTALDNVSFKINAGENVGVIGKTGAGKTTIVDLILRIYNVPNNSLFIDGHDVNRIPIRTVRGHCAYVPQDNFLFSDTIFNNIAFADSGIDREAVVNSSILADVHDNIIGFPKEYDTILGERGVTVSGGQKQRISIARALCKNAPILILDDSVSAVDTKTEKIILDNLRQTRKGKTTILIAHRISTVEKMDKIVFIDDGRVTAVGDHETLYNTCPDYRTMVELQRLEDEKGGNDHV